VESEPLVERHDRVVVVDFGAQYAQLIARRIREARVYSEIVPADASLEEVMALQPVGMVLSGGPDSVWAEVAPRPDPRLLTAGIPVLGICYGAQLIADTAGGVVERTGTGEFGRTTLVRRAPSVLFRDWPEGPIDVWMSHRDAVTALPEGFVVTASTPGADVAAFEDPRRRLYGVQFHPEVAHTERGQDLLERFLFDVCGARPTWTRTNIIEGAIEAIRERVGAERVLCALSGGVDSAVAAALVHRAVGDQLTCVFVDTGLLRANEAEQVVDTFERVFGAKLVRVDAADRFLGALARVRDPERKRRIVGETFIRVFEEVAREQGDARFLVQGTLYPDVVESGSGDKATIKTHHNVGGLPDDMRFELLEPLRALFKDEVRMVGEELGLPEEVVWRHPFPGPGLAVRIVGEVTEERLRIVRAADAIVVDEVRRAGLDRALWQAFAVLLAVRTVGVMGDGRSYAYPVVVRAVTSEDAMTADWARLPHELLDRMARRIVNEVPGVNRVAFDVTSKPPATIEWE
jgi:GMP synthase (glutamine-hydrolysing)